MKSLDFSKKSWFYSFLLFWGLTGPPIRGPPEGLASQGASGSRLRASARARLAGFGFCFRLASLDFYLVWLGFRLGLSLIGFDLASGFHLLGFWLDFGLILLDFGWIWFGLGSIFIDLG